MLYIVSILALAILMPKPLPISYCLPSSPDSFFTLVSLSPHSTHLYNTELPISFSASISPPQHAHFMTGTWQMKMKGYLLIWYLYPSTLLLCSYVMLFIFPSTVIIHDACFLQPHFFASNIILNEGYKITLPNAIMHKYHIFLVY